MVSKSILFFVPVVLAPALLVTAMQAQKSNFFDKPAVLAPEDRGDILMARKQYREAIDVYREGAANSALLHNKAGIAYHQLAQFALAKKEYEQSIKLNPKYAEAINNLGTIYYAERSYRRAIRSYRKAIALSPFAASLHSNLGTAFFARKDYAKAALSYQEALNLDPEVFEHHNAYGTLLQEHSYTERAKFHYYLAKTYAKAGRSDRALLYIRKALEEGFTERNKFVEDAEFSALQAMPEFKDLMVLHRVFYRAALLLLALLTAGCTKNQTTQRLAILRFENLTAEPINDWIGRAASEVLIYELNAIPAATFYKAAAPFSLRQLNAPGLSTELTGARLAGATRVIAGYYEWIGGELTITAIEEDAATGRTVRKATAHGSLLQGLETIGRQFSSSWRAFPTKSEDALHAFVLGQEAPEEYQQNYERAIAADPRFREPYLAWSERALAEGNRPSVQRILALAREHKLPPDYLAKLELADATLSHDPNLREKALQRLVDTNPSDVSAVKALADSEMSSHRFQSAAAHYAKIAGPGAPELLNLLVYARMYSGDEKGALDAVQEYQKAAPQDPNAIDSQGDVELYFGQFGDAEKSYLRAAAKDPNFNRGTEIWKAARARLMTGDVSGASEIFAQFRHQRDAAKDPLMPLRAAEWQYLSGDRMRAIEAILKATGTLKIVALAQASIWELQLGRKSDAIRDAELVMKAGQSPSAAAAAIVLFAALGPASASELKARAERSFHGPGSEQMSAVAAAYTLWFAQRYSEAAPLWKRIYAGSSPNDQGPQFLYAGALKESGGDDAALLKPNPIPVATAGPSFESLYFPKLFAWRGDRATYLKLSGSTAALTK